MVTAVKQMTSVEKKKFKIFCSRLWDSCPWDWEEAMYFLKTKRYIDIDNSLRSYVSNR